MHTRVVRGNKELLSTELKQPIRQRLPILIYQGVHSCTKACYLVLRTLRVVMPPESYHLRALDGGFLIRRPSDFSMIYPPALATELATPWQTYDLMNWESN